MDSPGWVKQVGMSQVAASCGVMPMKTTRVSIHFAVPGYLLTTGQTSVESYALPSIPGTEKK